MSQPLSTLDPSGIYAAWSGTAGRSIAQLREARRQSKLTAARTDVDIAYAAFRNVSDTTSAKNLREAVEAFIAVSG